MLAATLSTLTPRMRFSFSKANIENFAFKLHYKATVTLLLGFVILVCAREYFGAHIKCLSDQGVPGNVIETYCFFMATFTIVRHYNETLLQGEYLPHPGVGPMMNSDEKLHHTYYQWVPFILFIQSICFYLPHYVWKKKEGGRIKALVNGLQNASLALEDKDQNFGGHYIPSKFSLDEKIESIRKDIILRLRVTRTWSIWLVSMEVANLIHIIFQIWMTNIFLNGAFIKLGGKVVGFDDWDKISDPLERVFPKVTKCVFHKYGPSGSIQQHDALCVMALNIVHEKIYTVLWFWFLMLFIASTLAVIWRVISFFLYRRSMKFNELVFRKVSSTKFNPYNVISVVNGCEYGDWLFLYYLAKNMQGFVFHQLFIRLAEELEKRDMPYNEDPNEPKGAEPILIRQDNIDFDDETLPLRDEKKGL